MDAIVKCQLDGCDNPIPETQRGRPQRFCCDAHRKAHSRLNGQKNQTRTAGPKGLNGQVSGLYAASTGPTSPLADTDEVSPGLSWIEINDLTWKLVGDAEELIPGSHGQWGGYRTKKALAYIINIENKWLARCEDRAYGPTTFGKAKRAACAMYECGVGSKIATDPIAYLNKITARVIDGAAPKLETVAAEIKPHAERRAALQGDDVQLEYYEDGCPKLPACLDGRGAQ